MRNQEEAQEEGGPMVNVDAQDGIQDEPDRPLIPAEECFNPYVHDLQSPVTSSAAVVDITSQTPSEVAPSSATPDEYPTSVDVVQDTHDTHPTSSSFVSGRSLPLPHTSDRVSLRTLNIAIQDEQDNNLDNNNVTP